MKELSIEQKAQRYDEAIEIAKRINNEQQAQPFNIMTRVFPELKESEDERIRQLLIRFVKYDMPDNYSDDFSKEDCLDWLKKQGEQKPATWSEEDEENLNWFEKFFRPESLITKCKDIPQDKYLWFKSLKDRVQPQQKQEWNEDTQQWIDAIIFDYEFWYDEDKDHRTTIQAKINILKSLKDRCTWKPSDEQMEALHYVTNFDYGGHKATLVSLYEQLKKLKA